MFNPWILLGLLVAWAASVASACWLAYGFGGDSVRVEWDADKLDRSTQALDTIKEYRASERAMAAQLQEAQREAELERARRSAIAAGVRTDTDGVRRAIGAADGGAAAGDTLAACRDRAAALGLVLDRALQTSEACAGHAETASSDVRTLRRAWPVKGEESP